MTQLCEYGCGRISKKEAYRLFNEGMRERYGDDYDDIEYNKRD